MSSNSSLPHFSPFPPSPRPPFLLTPPLTPPHLLFSYFLISFSFIFLLLLLPFFLLLLLIVFLLSVVSPLHLFLFLFFVSLRHSLRFPIQRPEKPRMRAWGTSPNKQPTRHHRRVLRQNTQSFPPHPTFPYLRYSIPLPVAQPHSPHASLSP